MGFRQFLVYISLFQTGMGARRAQIHLLREGLNHLTLFAGNWEGYSGFPRRGTYPRLNARTIGQSVH